MAENMFAIFPDSRLASGHASKGGVARPKKTALCDVKNTLLGKKSNLNEPSRKLGQPVPLENPCKPSAKEFVKETPGKVTLKQGGTFAIACDDKENRGYWDACGACKHEDPFYEVRSPSERLKTADVNFLSKGLLALDLKKDSYPDHPCVEPVTEDVVEAWCDAVDTPLLSTVEPLQFNFSDEE